jgi:hypothetical protein
MRGCRGHTIIAAASLSNVIPQISKQYVSSMATNLLYAHAVLFPVPHACWY